MRHARLTLVLALGAAVAVVLPAGAATKKPPCKVVTDAPGDANSAPLLGTTTVGPATVGNGVGPSDPAYDILSVDVASDAKYVTGVIRVAKLAKTSQLSPTGIHWTASFFVNGTQYLMSANQQLVGVTGAELDAVDGAGGTYTKAAPATVIYDLTHNEVRITAKVRDFPNRITLGKTVLSQIGATAGRMYGVKDPSGKFGGEDMVAGQDYTDSAESTKTYLAGSKSCVTPNK
jgi:hypothetical protein